MAPVPPPRCRNDFKVAIICSLTVESTAVQALFDEYYDGDGEIYGRAPGDRNSYVMGRMGPHHVVLAFMPNMGKGAAAGVAASLRSSYPFIQLALILGVCGGVPRTPNGQEILLGDVVISSGIVHYDYGRRYPDKFVRRDAMAHRLYHPVPAIRSFLHKLDTQVTRSHVHGRMAVYMSHLRKEGDTRWLATYPGVAEDKLFKPGFHHKHRPPQECQTCSRGDDRICDRARTASCQQLDCEGNGALISRQRLRARGREVGPEPFPALHMGLVASGDTVMRSGIKRDKIAAQEKVIAFEMEAAGVWETLPCMLIKGVCDYADSHKNKRWQGYASAVAATCLRAILEQWTPEIPWSSPDAQHTAESTPHDSFVDGVWIGANMDSSVVASSLANQGGINLYHDASKEPRSPRRPPVPNTRRKKNGNYRVEIGGNVTRSVVANTVTNMGGINL